MEDTICAISTASQVAGIAIIRVSGKDAKKIVNKIFKGKNLEKVKSHTINYGFIVSDGEKVDEVLVTVMSSPKTFTKEDVVEINTHGGFTTTNKVLELLLLSGCRLAEPGEFTKRAFLNGRIDLVEAQSINDLIESKTENQRKLAMNNLTGKMSAKIQHLMDYILEIRANIEVNIDYPEYEDELVITHEILSDRLNIIKKEINNILKESKTGKLIKNGLNIALVGKPNTGKSSLLNKLIEEEKAIVTNIPGTTRDIIESSFLLNGYLVNLIDTAGIRKTDNLIEKMGIDKSLEQIENADLVLLILDGSKKLSQEDKDLLKKVKKYNYLIFINKSDLNLKIETEYLKNYDYVIGNTLNNELEELKNKIISKFSLDLINEKELVFITNTEHQALLKDTLNTIDSIFKNIKKNVPIDMLTIDLGKCYENLGKIIGKTYEEDLINEIFKNFCLGK